MATTRHHSSCLLLLAVVLVLILLVINYVVDLMMCVILVLCMIYPVYDACFGGQGPMKDASLLYLVANLLLWVPPPERDHTLCLSDKGIEFVVKHRLVQSRCVGR
jgi:hypothetical protein